MMMIRIIIIVPTFPFSRWKCTLFQTVYCLCDPFFKLIYYTDSIYKVYNDKLRNCFCKQFHYVGTYKQAETNSMTNNRGGNNGSEKWIEKKTLRLCVIPLFHFCTKNYKNIYENWNFVYMSVKPRNL